MDRKHVWHPYTAASSSLPCFPVHSCQGATISLSDGRHLIDGMSSWWACIHGYNHPALNAAAINQMNKMSHIMFGGLTHEPAVRLADRLVKLAASSSASSSESESENSSILRHVFYSDSGSVAVEVAMKMAIQYWHNLDGETKKSRFLTVRGGYHGDTFKAMGVCDPVNGMHHLFQSVLSKQLFANRPNIPFHHYDDEDGQQQTTRQQHGWDENDIEDFHGLLRDNAQEIAAVIMEPIVQGAGGMRFYHPAYLQRVRELCDQYDCLLILDEIATGFGRTGRMFACDHAGIAPDIMCIGKALSGGFISFAATLTTDKVAGTFDSSNPLMHGPTFMGNPLACAVSLASLDLLQSYDWQGKVRSIEKQLLKELRPCRESPLVQDVRVLGAIGVVEMKEAVNMKAIQPALVEEGVWLRPFGKLLYTMPPFIIKSHQLRKITRAMVNITRRKL